MGKNKKRNQHKTAVPCAPAPLPPPVSSSLFSLLQHRVSELPFATYTASALTTRRPYRTITPASTARDYWIRFARTLHPTTCIHSHVLFDAPLPITEMDFHAQKNYVAVSSGARMAVASLTLPNPRPVEDCWGGELLEEMRVDNAQDSKTNDESVVLQDMNVLDRRLVHELSEITQLCFADRHDGVANASSLIVSTCLGVGSRSGSLQIYSYECDPKEDRLNAFSLRYRFSPRKASIWTCAVSGTREAFVVASGASQNQVFITTPQQTNFRTQTLLLPTLPNSGSSDVFAQVFQPSSGALLLSGTRGGNLFASDWRRATGQTSALHLGPASQSKSPLCSLVFRSETGLLASHMDGAMRYWDLRWPRAPMCVMRNVNSFTKVNVELFDGSGIAVGAGEDGVIRTWDVDMGVQVAERRVCGDGMGRELMRVKVLTEDTRSGLPGDVPSGVWVSNREKILLYSTNL
ncbi:hypothetical protein BC830DRAFT_5977 [Chytriomyces sp. MP71]|nr:hypothetical protein BC830DRAFT_5977 [Chytriomyces sp. MP71]